MRTHMKTLTGCATVFLLTAACSKEVKPPGVSVMPAGKPYSGFLSDYSKLKQNPDFENTVRYVREEPNKNIHRYVAVIVDPVSIFVATDDASRSMPDRGRTALANYFHEAIIWAV